MAHMPLVSAVDWRSSFWLPPVLVYFSLTYLPGNLTQFACNVSITLGFSYC